MVSAVSTVPPGITSPICLKIYFVAGPWNVDIGIDLETGRHIFNGVNGLPLILNTVDRMNGKLHTRSEHVRITLENLEVAPVYRLQFEPELVGNAE